MPSLPTFSPYSPRVLTAEAVSLPMRLYLSLISSVRGDIVVDAEDVQRPWQSRFHAAPGLLQAEVVSRVGSSRWQISASRFDMSSPLFAPCSLISLPMLQRTMLG